MRDAEQGLVTTSGAPTWLARIGDRLAWYASSIGLHRYARVGALALVAVLLIARPSPLRWLVVAVLAIYVVSTTVVRQDARIQFADLAVSLALIVVFGATVLPFLPFLLVAVAHPASTRGVRAGVAAGGTLAMALLLRLAVTGQLATMELSESVSIALMLPLAGLTAAAATELLEDRSVRDRLVLQQANRLLSSLRAIAADIPGGLDASTVAAATLAEVRSLPGAVAAVVLVEDGHTLVPASATGLGQRHVPTLDLDEARSLLEPPGRLHTPASMPGGDDGCWVGHRHWVALGMGRPEQLAGLLIVGFDDLEAGRAARPRLASIAADGGIALENARLFDGTRARAADAARRQVAGDLHDGVAQSLAHLRMELELLARADTQGDDLGRLAGVASTALEDLRSTIAGLRRSTTTDLAAALEEHLDAVRSPRGPELTFAAIGTGRLDPDRADDVLRIAQEAVSNAVRHARATSVLVTLEQDTEQLLLVIEDDGVGVDSSSPERGGNVGLASMHERAERLGGRLEIRPGRGGGTVVSLTCATRSTTSLPALRRQR